MSASTAGVGAPTVTIAPLQSPLSTTATTKERAAYGVSLQRLVPLESHADLAISVDRPSPVALLEAQSASRVPDLVPIRYGRMLVSPFTFYRGAARVMAADLAGTARTGLPVQACGDAHLSNFGLFATPERRLVFDVNDFDETLVGPWEWDVKRLVTSLVIAGRDNGLSAKQVRKVALAATASYRNAMAQFAQMRDLDVWYAHADVDDFGARVTAQLDQKRRKALAKGFAKARTRDSMQALSKLTRIDGGRRVIRSDPPLLVPIAELLSDDERAAIQDRFFDLLDAYKATLRADLRPLLDQYRFADMARKVVGVGSVGTRCWVVLMLGRDEDDPLFLQIKEAQQSVLEEFLDPSGFDNQGERVVTGQRRTQESSDIFLGWLRTDGVDGVRRDFYFRQLRDWKMSVDIGLLRPKGLVIYGTVCAWALARSHARTGDRVAISSYLGESDAFDRALLKFAEVYAGLNERDHLVLSKAVADGEVTALTGV